jgi:hypothetical protein
MMIMHYYCWKMAKLDSLADAAAPVVELELDLELDY